jgi:predicted small lipoprotein YifL
MRRNSWPLIAVLLATLAGCGAPIPSLPPQAELETRQTYGELTSKKPLGPRDEVYQRLNALLAAERSGWWPNFVSNVAAPFVVRAQGTTISCYRNVLVIDIAQAGSPASWSKEIPDLLSRLGLEPAAVPGR